VDKETVDIAQKEAEEAWIKLSILKDAYIKANNDYLKKASRFRNFDYELALTDGRLKKLPPQGTKKVKKQPELTIEQLRSIAEKLGFNLNNIEEPEEEMDEESVEDLLKEEEVNEA
jgi:hypothetical protein